jgi:NAD(P)-dependent dehydrogenase (short-subunit alcohol dehydrogenase family)
MSNILVTGASKGFGSLTVRTLLKEGHRVAAAMRGRNGKNQSAAAELQKAGAVPVELDVTDEASVEKGVKEAVAGVGPLDVVVNNAGVGVLGLQESFTPDDWQKIFEVNVFGVQRVNRAVLPAMRERRAGLLVHVSSLLGRVVIPFYGPYIASKFALEALADGYRLELSSLGIESVIVEPGGYATTFMDALVRPSDTARSASYGPMGSAPEQSLANYEKHVRGPNGPDPQWVADAVAGVIRAPRGRRPFRTTADRTGMGAAVDPYNEAAEAMQRKILGSFGREELLSVKF